MWELVLNSFVTLLVVVDPVGLAPIFVALTRGEGKAYRREMAVRGTMLGAAILLLFAFIGDGLLSALGIGIPAFRIAGGSLLFLLAIDMVLERPSRTREAEGESAREDISVFPLAIPLIAGPGALTTVLLYTGGRGVEETAIFLGVLVVVLGLTLASLLAAPRIMSLFGEKGSHVLSRVLGVILAALAVQFVLDGIRQSFGV